ncbi:MAG: DUF429 domain-containing protein [Burkholderiales bacterium]|nr:DUF429 domain-containing protein [Burkholderiales bacterium]
MTTICGIDFTSAPSRRKRIAIAGGRRRGDDFALDGIDACADWHAFEAWLARPGPWVGGFDFPFGLPRPLVESLGWPAEWRALIARYAALSRAEIRALFRAYCDARPAGAKFAHRACDIPAGASPSMKWVNPPVAWMLHAGAPRLIAAGVHIPGLADGDRARVALEAYPGYTARLIVGRASYKSDDPARQTPARRDARRRIVAALEAGAAAGLPRLRASPRLMRACIDDASGDSLDAVICALQAAWGLERGDAGFGLPPDLDPLEGWIVGVPAPARLR